MTNIASDKKELNWTVLGTGVIANQMASALHDMDRQLYGVANRTYENAVTFAEKYGVKKVFPTYESVFDDPEVDVVYITTPHNTHYPYMKAALEHGKHLFVEKSITLNSRELSEMRELAEKNGLVLAEAMHSKQPKRAMISCEKAYIEIMEYPRADRAVIVDAETGEREEIVEGSTANALQYEMMDMEAAILEGKTDVMRLSDSCDVMDMMTGLRKEWGMKYPGEEW